MLTVTQVADILCCSRTNVYALEKSGMLASVRTGAGGCCIRFDEAEVDRFKKSGGVRTKEKTAKEKKSRYWAYHEL